jgi:hypothetical protein
MMTEATVERLSGQIKAQKILIQILMGQQVLQSKESAIVVRETVRAAFLVTRRSSGAVSEEERCGSNEIFEQALETIEFLRSSGERK